MVFVAVVLVLMVIVVVVAAQYRPAHVRGGAAAHGEARPAGPISRAGVWSLWAVGIAVVMQLVLAPVVTWGGVPAGVAAFVLGLVALGRDRDRALVLVVPVVVGLVVAASPFLFWLLD